MSGARQIATKLFLLAEMHLFLLNKHFMDCWKPWVHLFKLCRSLDIARSFYTSALSSSYLCAIVTEVARRTASVASTTAGGSVWSPGSAWTEVRAPHSPNSRPRAAPGMFPKNKVSWH
ncbi:uncharacterized protein LOC111092073 isoform X3 [Canis lupus familiaris]|uniref:uncharacterized protein LOC111092073 isoform X3 n=1 Tax=Canis lupus familiaris TaxID=9615 RepID=UPI0018F50C07|nr:uncharacterized protein LOC111092073 isoform X3 [Canis lupus familiaris]